MIHKHGATPQPSLTAVAVKYRLLCDAVTNQVDQREIDLLWILAGHDMAIVATLVGLLERATWPEPVSIPDVGLTPREIQVLRLIDAGHTYDNIGGLLGIAPATVKSHVQSILRKLDARNAAQAVGLAIRSRILGGAAA